MNLKFVRPHKSIRTFPSIEIPHFAIITGPNGCGKTHLLESIAEGAILIDGISKEQVKLFDWNNFALKGSTLSDPAKFFGNKTSVFSSLAEYRSQHLSNLSERLASKGITADLKELVSAARLSESDYNSLVGEQKDVIPYSEIVLQFNSIRSRIRDNFSTRKGEKQLIGDLEAFADIDILTVEENEFTTSSALLAGGIDPFAFNVSEIISSYNYKYQLNNVALYLNEKRGGQKSFLTEEEFEKEYGPPPWILLNRILNELRIEYHFSDPPDDPVAHYQASLVGPNGKVNFQDLSSGERILMSLALTLYRARGNQKHAPIPRLLLLDEIDAPLHPSMTKQMLFVIEEVLCRDLGINVLLTTHSPSTVALATELALYRLFKEPRELQKYSKEQAVQDLSSGLIAVTDNTKFVIVEGDDKTIYNDIFRACVSKGYVKNVPPVAFVGAINRKTQHGGDKGQVRSWATKLREAGIQNIFGLVDRDGDNQSETEVTKLGRYSIENYLLDPILIYSTLLDRAEHNAVLERKFLRNEASAILNCSADELQSIANAVCRLFESATPDLKKDSASFSAKYANGIAIDLPIWYRDTQGHQLESIANAIVTKTLKVATITRPKFEPLLTVLVNKVPELIPIDLVEITREIQARS